MANIASARKRARQAVQLNAHNSSLRSRLRTAIKKVRKAVAAGDKAAAEAQFRASTSVIDSIADKKIIHKNAAARHKSRLSAALSVRNVREGSAQRLAPLVVVVRRPARSQSTVASTLKAGLPAVFMVGAPAFLLSSCSALSCATRAGARCPLVGLCVSRSLCLKTSALL